MPLSDRDAMPSQIPQCCICVDSYCGCNITGRLYNCCEKVPIVFKGIEGLFLGIERCLDKVGYPQGGSKLRSFDNMNAKNNIFDGSIGIMDEKFPNGKKGDKATFIVQIQFRQNATWQGYITWTDTERTEHFKSAMEMLKLIENSLGESEEEE